MESWGVWKLIKVGFWLGIGFILPQLAVFYSGTILTAFAAPLIIDSTIGTASEDYLSNFNRTDQIQIIEQREQQQGKQLLILGKIENIGDKSVSSIQLEAELTNSDGKFVYECSDYIQKDMNPGDIENYQIKCGCGKTPLPDYENVTVRVVSATSF